jgi:hypothetical protein
VVGSDERPPEDLREGVRSGIVASLERDLAQRGGRTARRLGIAGVIGVLAAVGVTLLLSGHPYGHHPSWHAVVFGAVWTGLLVSCLSLMLLEVRTPSLPLARAAEVAMLGLGLAGICGALCPDQHFLHWWSNTAVGSQLIGRGGLALGALCFGAVSALSFAAGAVLIGIRAKGEPMRPLLPAAMLLALLAPGVALQSVDTSWAVFWSWLFGTGAGAYAGVASGSPSPRARLRRWVRTRRRGSPSPPGRCCVLVHISSVDERRSTARAPGPGARALGDEAQGNGRGEPHVAIPKVFSPPPAFS